MHLFHGGNFTLSCFWKILVSKDNVWSIRISNDCTLQCRQFWALICSFWWPFSSAVYLWFVQDHQRVLEINGTDWMNLLLSVLTHKHELDNILIQVQRTRASLQVQEFLGPSGEGELVGRGRDLYCSWKKMKIEIGNHVMQNKQSSNMTHII